MPPRSLLPAAAAAAEASIPGESIEFIHIGKTAGGSIEELGLALGHLWGKRRPWPQLEGHAMPCQRTNLLGGVYEGHSWHHVPRCHWARHGLRPLESERPSFCVVRHPYSRAISAFAWRHRNLPIDDYCSARGLNEYVQQRLTAQRSLLPSIGRCDLTPQHGVDDCHWLPQWLYLPCDHTLRYEHLHRELTELMKNFSSRGLLLRGGARELPMANATSDLVDLHVHGSSESACHLNADTLDAHSRSLLDEVYAKDFELLGYEPSRVPTPGPTRKDAGLTDLVLELRNGSFAARLVDARSRRRLAHV